MPASTACAALSVVLLAAPARAQEPAPAPSASDDGFQIQSDDGAYRLQLRAYAHFDGRFFPGDDDGLATDTFLVRRARPILQGTVARRFDFNLTPDFGGGTATLQDAFVDIRYAAGARLRAGKFKSPVGLERLQSATNIAFPERALPAALTPNRDVGLQLHGEVAGGIVGYAAALLNGSSDGASGDLDGSDGKELAGRLFLSPFKRRGGPLADLGFGIAATRGVHRGALPAYRSGGQLPIVAFLEGAALDGRRTRYVPQLSLYSGPLGLMAEFARSRSAVRTAEGAPAVFAARAWHATATLLLTADRASFTGVRPARPFDPARGQWGALELAARVNGFRVDGEAFAAGVLDLDRSVRTARAWAVGVNWYLNRNVKQVAAFERTVFTGGAPGGADRDAENALFVRTQLSF
jgi:phosphate-selective porin OprO/OprP